MKKYLAGLLFLTFLSLGNCLWAGGIDVRVDYELKKNSTGHLVDISVTNVDNGQHNVAELEHPGNRSTLSFIVYDSRFNLVQPIGIGKADPPGNKITVKPNETFHYSRLSHSSYRGEFVFDFVTGTAWYGYVLEKGQKYRVIAVYRGWGNNGFGICSKEKVIEY